MRNARRIRFPRPQSQSHRKQPLRRPLLESLEDRCLLATNITQYHVDSQSTGANLTETQLTPLNVNASSFGQLYNTPLDGQVYAEPLVLTNIRVTSGGSTSTYGSVVFVATQHDSLYAINSVTGAVLWQRSFLDTSNPNDFLPGATSVTTVPSGDTYSDDIVPEIGIVGTPVIDQSTNLIYVIAKTKETVNGNAYYVSRLHAINDKDGSDATSAFMLGKTTNGNDNTTPIFVNGTGDGNVNGVVQFNALRENNRPALSLVNGQVYAAYASHGDNGPYHGWVLSWNVQNLATNGFVLTGVLCTDPNGGEGGIWGGGGGLTFDPSETINGQPAFYFETGNGNTRGVDPPLDANGFPTDRSFYESLLKVVADPTTTSTSQNPNGWGLKVADYFTPFNVNALDAADADFGSGSPLVLPDSAGIPDHPHLIVAAGKEGKIYLVDRDNMGKFAHNTDNVLNAVYNPNTGVTTPPVLINGSLSTPAYYHGTIYWVPGYGSNAWSYVVAPIPNPNNLPHVPAAAIQPTSETANANFGYVPGSVVVSANGTEDPNGGIVWIMDRGNGSIHAYSSLTLSTELWNSGGGSINTVKFAVPTVANGQVFVGTQNSLQVFGIIGTPTPIKPPNTVTNVTATVLSGTSIELTWTDTTTSPNFATSYTIRGSQGGGGFFTTYGTASQQSTNFTVTGLNPNSSYSFFIVSNNSAGSSAGSALGIATTTNQTGQTPTAPLGLGATPASGSEAYLTWTNTATNQTGFTLTRATDSLFTQNVVTQTLASAPYYFTDATPGMSPGHTYYYRLQATNAAGASSFSNTSSVNIPNVPPAPTNASAVYGAGQVVVSWTDHAGPYALGYQISRSVDDGPYVIYANAPETSDHPPSTQSFIDGNIVIGHTYSYQIVAQNVAGFSAPANTTVSVLGTATLTLDAAGKLTYVAGPGVPDRLALQVVAGVYTLTDAAVLITVNGAGAGFVTGGGTSSVTIPAAKLTAITLDTGDNADAINIVTDALPITITADSGGGTPAINLGDPTQNETISGQITNASSGPIMIGGAGTTIVTGKLISQGGGGVVLGGSGTIQISGNIDLGQFGNLVDNGSGAATISGVISGASSSGLSTVPGLIGTYFNLPAASNQIEPAVAGNPAWLGNQAPAVTSRLVGPIDFPDIADNGFLDSAGNPNYYDVGVNVEARWYGNIIIPGTGTTPVPINFATSSDDGSMIYIDGQEVVNNNYFQGVTQRTGLVNLTPGVHTVDIEFYQGGGGAGMFAQWDTTGGNNFVDIPNSAFSSIQAANGVSLTGTGTLTLTKANTYTGPTTINGGTLIVTANGAMGPAAANGVVVNPGGALALSGGVKYTNAEPITLRGNGPAGKGAMENLSGANTWAGAITLSGGATIGSDAGSLTVGGITSAGNPLSIIGAGTTIIAGNIATQGGNVSLAGSGVIKITGNISLGLTGNLFDTSTGQDTITGIISGSAATGSSPGLVGTYFNLPAASNQIAPADPSNPAWLGNQAPAVTAQLVGPIDFPSIDVNGFLDSVGDPNYYAVGVNVEARWYGDIMIPGTGTTPVPINFATTSDDGSMIYIDGQPVVNNNYFQGATQRTGIAMLTPGPHTIDIEFYQGGGGASMFAQWDTTGGNNFVDIPNSAFFVPVNEVFKTGVGTLTLSNTNTYSGATMINAGTLVVTKPGAMGLSTAAGVFVQPGAALAISGGFNYTSTETITISGSGPAGNGAIESIGANQFIGNNIFLAAPATIGSDAGALKLTGNITNGPNPLTLIGAGSITINGKILGDGGNITLASGGGITITGNINLGSQGKLIDSSTGNDRITGIISGTSPSSTAQGGLYGTYYNLPAAANQIQPANSSNPSWLGNQTPAATAKLIGPIDFPDITDNGFADILGDPAYYNIGGGNNNVEARWYGVITIPGVGNTPVPINFATTSDDGSMLYIDGQPVVSNNFTQGATQRTGLVNLTPGPHTIDIEYYQGNGLGSMVAQWDPTGGNNFVDIPYSAFQIPSNDLLKTGTGTLTLTNTNTYTGSTTVNAGQLLVDGKILKSSGVTVNAGGTLGGNGFVPSTVVQAGGVFAPGDGIGTLTPTKLTMSAGATFQEVLAGATPGTQYDQTVIPAGGSAALNNATLSALIPPSFTATVGQQFTIIRNLGTTAIGGAFSQGSTFTANGYTFAVNYAGGAGRDVVLTVLGQTTTLVSSSLGSPPSAGVYGQSVTFTATVSANSPVTGTPSGLVTFMDGSITLGTFPLVSGTASVTVPVLTVGAHNITASFSGTNSWLNSGGSVSQLVNQASTTTTLASSLTSTVFNQSITFTATVSPNAPGAGTPSGLVTFMDGAVALGSVALNGVSGNDQASFTTAALGAGTHNITAVYSSDTNFLGGTSAGIGQPVSATPQLQSGVLALPGTSANATITLSPAIPTGATAYSLYVTYLVGTTSTRFGPFAVSNAVIYGGPATDSLLLKGTAGNDSFTAGNGIITENAGLTTPFTVALNGILTTTINGYGGIDSLAGQAQANTWLINGKNAGVLNTSTIFQGITNLTGGSVSDVFKIAAGGSLLGNLTGVAPSTTLDYSLFGTPVTVNLQAGTAKNITGTWSNITNFIGSGGNDTLTGPNTTSNWTVNGSNAGSVGSYGFSAFRNLTGGSGNDTFVFMPGGSLGGNIVAGLGVNTLDQSLWGSPVTVNLQARTASGVGGMVSGLQTFIGTGTTDAVVGLNSGGTWTINGSNAGTLGTNAFLGFPNLVGGLGNDGFKFVSPGSLSGRIDGGGGSNTITGDNNGDAFTVNGLNAGMVATILPAGFSNIQNLIGGTGNDGFSFLTGGSLAAGINGGSGVNTLNDAGLGVPVTVNLQAKTATGIGTIWSNLQSFIGTGTSDKLIGTDTSLSWRITGSNAGTAGSFAFSGFSNLTGGAGNDTFKFVSGGTLTGAIDGQGGTNALDYSTYGSPVTVNLGNATTDLPNSSATGVNGGAANGIANISAVTVGSGDNYLTAAGVTGNVSFTATGNGSNIMVGGAGSNTLTANGSGNNILIGGQGTAVLNGGTGYNLLIGGTTAYDAVLGDLEAILAIWKTVKNSSTYSAAIAKLMSSTTAFPLTSATVHGNNTDTINARTHALDWYFAALASEIVGAKSGETDTQC